jgi:hypothetical protein
MGKPKDQSAKRRPPKPSGQISDVFGTLKRKGSPRISLKKIKEITEKGWAGQLKL